MNFQGIFYLCLVLLKINHALQRGRTLFNVVQLSFNLVNGDINAIACLFSVRESSGTAS